MTTPHERIHMTRAQVDRAGDVLRDWRATRLQSDRPERDASAVLSAYRAEFKDPLRKVVMDLRSAVRTEDAEVVVSERLKRQPRIVGKLARFHNMELTRMQDIGGCRAILDDVATVDAVRRRIERQKSEIVKVNDYNVAPRSSGYRAVHIVVRREGALIEIQLRTWSQQRWASLVEDLDGVFRLNLKDEQGPAPVLHYLRVYAAGLAELDASSQVSAGTATRVSSARAEALRLLREGGTR
jgi:putative GTP pyrophosphokinase